MSISEFVGALGSKTPTPGGGAVAAVTAATAVGLGRMVLAYSKGKKDLAAHHAVLQEIDTRLEGWSGELLLLADQDAQAYGVLNALQKLPMDDERRRREFPGAVKGAIGAPVRVLAIAAELCAVVHKLPGMTNVYLRSDLAMSALLGAAAARSALINVRINLPLMEQVEEREALRRQCESLSGQAVRLGEETAAACG